MKLEIRRDYITGRRSVIAVSRKFRPSDLHPHSPQTPSSTPATCPFCPGNEHMTPPEIKRYGGRKWRVRVFRNKFPAFSPDAKKPRSKWPYVKESARGDHWVIVDVPDHGIELEEYPKRHVDLAFKTFYESVKTLYKNHLYVHWIKNRGKEGGASLSHSHAQVFAFDYVPYAVYDEMELALSYFENKGRNIFDSILENELFGPRLVYENSEVAVISPFAPQINFHVEFISKVDKLPRYTYVADAFRRVVRAADNVLGKFPYTAFMRFPLPYDKLSAAYYRWNMHILPRVQTWAGFELGTGDRIISVAPEDWAKQLRRHID